MRRPDEKEEAKSIGLSRALLGQSQLDVFIRNQIIQQGVSPKMGCCKKITKGVALFLGVFSGAPFVDASTKALNGKSFFPYVFAPGTMVTVGVDGLCILMKIFSKFDPIPSELDAIVSDNQA